MQRGIKMIELLLIGACPAEPGTPAYARYECAPVEPVPDSETFHNPSLTEETESEKDTSNGTSILYADKKVGRWLIYQAHEGSCSALVGVKGENSATYEASQTYIFGFSRDYRDRFWFPSKPYKYYSGSEKMLLLKFDRSSSLALEAHHFADIDYGIWNGYVSNQSWFRQSFVDANSASLFLDGKLISQTSLAGSSAAMREVEVCLASPGKQPGE
jgi:hypothetical protein